MVPIVKHERRFCHGEKPESRSGESCGMEHPESTWPPVLGLGLFAALGFVLAAQLGLPALGLGFPLLALHRPIPWLSSLSRRSIPSRISGPLLGLGFFVGALGALEQTQARWQTDAGPMESRLVRFEGVLLEDGRRRSFGGVEARIRVGAQVLTLSLDQGTLLEGSWIEGTALWDRTPNHSSLQTRFALCQFRSGFLRGLRLKLRTYLDQQLARYLSPHVAGLVHRLLLGRDEELPAKIERSHRRWGLSHLLAISGMHTLFLASFMSWLLRPLFSILGGELRILAPLLLGYAWLTGGQPPVLRAVLGFLFWRTCWVRGWPFDIAACIGFAALVVLVLFPEDFASPSFLLSYAATVALVCFLQALRALLGRLHAGGPLFTLLAASIAAQIGTAALSLQYFGHLAPWGILATPILLPLLFLMLALGLLFFLALPFPLLLPPLSLLLEITGRTWFALVQAPPSLPGAPLRPLYLPPEDLTLILLLSLATLAFLLRSRKWLLTAFLLPLLPWFIPWSGTRHEGLTLLSIGPGLTSVIETSDKTLVFDCGDSSEGRRSTRAILAHLRKRGPAHIDDLILSHADQDHTAALPELLLRLDIDRIWLPESPKVAWIQRLLQEEALDVRLLPPGARSWVSPDTLLLSPHDNGDLAGSNDGGLALYHRFAEGPDLLLTGDQEEAGTAALLRAPDLPARIDLLVLPHHGSGGSRFERLVQRFRPRYCLASTGSRRKIDRRLLDALAPGLPLLRTGSSGDIRIHRDPAGEWRVGSDRGADILPRKP